jgi:hypothetical protein
VSSFTSTTSDASYGVDSAINITATTSEAVVAGSNFTVTLGTNDTVVLTAASAGTTLSGTYTVSTGDSSADLNISSFEVASGQSITDIYGNAMTSTTLPSGNNLADNSALVIDAAPPTSTITSVAYNVSTGVLAFTGTNFDGIGAASASTDIKSSLDWTKLSWDINGDNATTSNVSFAESSIASAVVTNASTLTVTLTSTAKNALEQAAGFGAAGGTDTIDVTAGFIKDISGNVSTTDGKANAAITYSDATAPTVSSFTSTTSDASYGVDSAINITATMSEAVVAGSNFTANLDTGDSIILTSSAASATLVGEYTVSAGDTSTDLTVTSFVTASGQSVTDIYGNVMTANTNPVGNNMSDNEAIVIDTQAIFALGNATLVQNDGNGTADLGDVLQFLFSEGVSNTVNLSNIFESGATYGSTSAATTQWSSNGGRANSKLEVTLGEGETYSLEAITLTSVLDSAGNSSDLTYNVV